jgi:hypothetical protein
MAMPAVKSGATLMCTFGLAPSTLRVLQPNRDATVADGTGMSNVPPFGMCQSMANPAVAAASAAARGVLTPMPCTPVCSMWVPGDPTTQIQGIPALTRTSQLMCAFAGVITIVG